MLTTEQLNAIKERAEKATAGPWEIDDIDRTIWNKSGRNYVGSLRKFPIADIEFITQARTDIPTLIAEVERLRKELEFRQKVIEIIARDTQCDDTWDFANRIKSGMQPLTLSYRIGGGVDD